uniref:Uncharacterized protein n=1 Tax=Ananas comosus var. bracteatus TaxID=296719 RepID=A0A6V7P021_ANACO|nr:unnamed protein product [Ananas comosus var. bracteatus]
MMQVTEFKCGGVAVGITYNHLVFDGLGAAQFVNAVAELARGLAEPSVSPAWRRDSIPGPPPPAKPTSAPNLTFYRFTPSEFDFPLESIDWVKGRVRSESGLGCTTFEAVTAMTWRSRTRAVLRSEPDADVRLSFMANVRPVLCDRLGIRGGYYGNCVYPVGISAPGERVAGESLTALVGLIREAKRTVTAEFTAWLSGDAGKERFNVPLNYGTLMVTEWSRLGYGDVDYGGWARLRLPRPGRVERPRHVRLRAAARAEAGGAARDALRRGATRGGVSERVGEAGLTQAHVYQPRSMLRTYAHLISKHGRQLHDHQKAADSGTSLRGDAAGSHRLSFLDRRPEIRLSLDVLLVFRRGGGEDPAKTIREGLSRALVHYYPVAGRIAEPAGGELAIECSGDGVWFVEASAEGRLDGFGDWI